MTDEAEAHLAQLIHRAARHDRAALRALYDATSGQLLGLLRIMVRDEQVAQEILQDVYLTVWLRGARFDAELPAPLRWLITIARNKAIDRLRAERTAPEVTELPEDLLDPTTPVLAQLESGERQRRLMLCLAGLPPEQRVAIRAAFFGGLSYERVAERLGAPVGTIKSRIRRGLLALRGCLGE